MEKTKISNQKKNIQKWSYIYILTIYVILHWYGFPGEYVKVFGPSFDTAVKYSVFFSQLIIMPITSGESLFDLKIIDFKRIYKHIYFFLFAIITISMIGTNIPRRQMELCFSLSINILFVIWICEHFSVKDLLELTYYSQLIFIVLSIAYPLFFPGYYYNEWRAGVFLGILRVKNVAAAQMSFGVALQTILFKIRKNEGTLSASFIVVYILQWVLLILTQGGNALLCSMGVIVYVFLWNNKMHRINWGVANVVLSTGFIVFAMTIMQKMDPIFNYFGKDATLTGRTVTWRKIIEIMQESHTFTGYGYCIFWEDPDAVAVFHKGFNDSSEAWYSTMTSGAHNNLMELWLTIGLAGIVIYFLVLIVSLRNPQKWSEEKYIFIAGYSILFILFGMTEKSFTTYGYMTMYLFLVLGYAVQSDT